MPANIAEAGADALEINVFFLPLDRKKSASRILKRIYFELIEKLKTKVKIPIAIKIGYALLEYYFI